MVSFESVIETLRRAGAKVVDSTDFPEADGSKKLNHQVRGIVRSSEFKRDTIRYLRALDTNPNNIQSAEDIIEFTKTSPADKYRDRDIGKFLWTQAEDVDVDSDKYRDMVKQEQL